jgi:hypothetical protein
VRRLASFLELCAVVCCDAVDYDDANIVSLDQHWDLILQNVFLRFKVVNTSALNAGESRLLIRWQISQFRVCLENLVQSSCLKLSFARDVKSCAWSSIVDVELRRQQ